MWGTAPQRILDGRFLFRGCTLRTLRLRGLGFQSLKQNQAEYNQKAAEDLLHVVPERPRRLVARFRHGKGMTLPGSLVQEQSALLQIAALSIIRDVTDQVVQPPAAVGQV